MDSCPLPNDLQGQAPACRNDGGGVACRCAFVAGHRSFAEPLSLYLRRTLWLVSMFIVWDVIDRLS